MLVFGAIDFAAAVARVGSFLGYQVTVCDARPVFATPARFPDADEVVVEWPHRYLRRQAEAGAIDPRTVIAVLTHDPKFDVPLLEVALRLPEVAYIGAMGSRRTHDDRLDRLREAGLTDAELARMSSPIGLDLGARTPEETAVSIAAEIIALRWGGGGQRLGELGRPHPRHRATRGTGHRARRRRLTRGRTGFPNPRAKRACLRRTCGRSPHASQTYGTRLVPRVTRGWDEPTHASRRRPSRSVSHVGGSSGGRSFKAALPSGQTRMRTSARPGPPPGSST